VSTPAAVDDPERPHHPSQIEQWRRTYRRNRNRRAAVIAATSSAVVLVVAWAVITHAPGWPRFQQAFLSWHEAVKSFPTVGRGLLTNLEILGIAEVCILILALGLATLRTLRGPVFFPIRFAATLYVDLFRGVPLFILLLLFGFGLPSIRLQGVPTSPLVLATIAIILNYTAYVSEVFRAGIETVHPSQRAAARSLGLTYGQTLRLVVLPQAVRAVLPPLLNDFVSLQKDVGLVSIIGVVDAVLAAQIVENHDYNQTPLVLAAVLFIALAAPTARIADAVGARLNSRQRAGALV
jgi:polar amino acid transport system permease protein